MRPRCDLAIDRCHESFPEATEFEGGHLVHCYRAKDAPGELSTAGEPTPATEPGDVVISIEQLNASYGSRHTLFDIDLAVRRNECVALVGESGSGKTTLARCVAGLHREYTGEIRLDAQRLQESSRKRSSEERKQIQYVFQNPYASLNPRRTVDRQSPASCSCSIRGPDATRAGGWASAWSGWRCPRRPPTAFPISSPAASVSGWRSPARWRRAVAAGVRRDHLGARRVGPGGDRGPVAPASPSRPA